jgi:hypothetical protein
MRCVLLETAAAGVVGCGLTQSIQRLRSGLEFTSQFSVGPTQSLVQWVVKLNPQEREADRFSASSVEVKNVKRFVLMSSVALRPEHRTLALHKIFQTHYITAFNQMKQMQLMSDFPWQFRTDVVSFQPRCGPGVDSASNRNEYQESSWGVKGGRRVRLRASPPSVSRLSR